MSAAEPPLVKAARLGDVSAVQRLLADPDAATTVNSGQYHWSGTALYRAAAGNHAAVVRLLLDAGAHVSLSGGSRGTPLAAAAALGHEAIVRLLLDEGASADEDAALAWAAWNGHEAVVELLLAAGADVNRQPGGSMQRTPLQAAVMNNHAGIVQQLLAAGAEPSGGEARSDTVWLAAGRGYTSVMLKLLAAGADPNGGHYPPLVAAAEEGHGATVKVLLAAGADVNRPNCAGATALMAGAQGGYEAVVRHLLAAGAAVDAVFRQSGETALVMAAEAGHEAAVEQLVAAGAAVNLIQYPACNDALFLAAVNGHLGIVQRLLAAGATGVDKALQHAVKYPRRRSHVIGILMPFVSISTAVWAARETQQWWRLRPVLAMLLRRHAQGENVQAAMREVFDCLPNGESAWLRTGMLALHRPQMTVTFDNRAVPVSLPPELALHVICLALC